MAKQIYLKIAKFLGSKVFFWLVITFFVLESLWIAFSLRYPMIYDEGFHFPVIKIFSHHALPFITNQPHSYDQFGNLAHTNSVLYHYIMSWPYRIISGITGSLTVQVIFLRTLNIIMVGAGLVVFARLLRKINIKQAHINIGLSVFALLPIVPMVAATINYDNMLFLLTALYLLIGVRLVKNIKVVWYDYANLIIVGCFASLVKNTFLPVFAASLIYLAVFMWRKHGKKFWSLMKASIKKAQRRWLALAAVGLIVSMGLFSATYVQNVVRYGTPHPACQQTMSLKRCQARAVVVRNEKAKATISQRPALALPDYTEAWFKNMIFGSTFSPAVTAKGGVIKGPLPIMYGLIFFGAIVSVAVLLYAWRSLNKNASWYFLITMVAVLFASVYLFNVHGYYAIHAAYGNQPRYLLSMLPVLLVMVAASVGYSLRHWPWLKLAGLIALLLLFTQGGGSITHIIRSDDDWYWQNSKVIKVNHAAKKVLSPIVRENYGKYGF